MDTRVIAIYAKCAKRRRKKTKKFLRNFADSYLGNGLRDLLKIWNLASPEWRLTPQYIWCYLDKVSRSYGCMKIATLSIYSLRLHTPCFLGPHNTLSTVCLDLIKYILKILSKVNTPNSGHFAFFLSYLHQAQVIYLICGNTTDHIITSLAITSLAITNLVWQQKPLSSTNKETIN